MRSHFVVFGAPFFNLLAGVVQIQEPVAAETMLAYALATQMVAPPTNPWTGVSFPLWESDFCGPTCYSGNVTFGSTNGIPSAVNLNALGLAEAGLAVARALQNYGAIMTETRGQPSQNVVFFAEEAAEGSSQLNNVRNDLATIIPQLRTMRNQGPRSVNGGTPLVATQAGLGVCQGVQ